MSDTAVKERRKTSNRALDIFVVLFCLSGAIASLYYFYRDIYATFRALNTIPAGTVTVKYNTVQRRIADRVVWDRLFAQSPVYSGDLVRIAQLSGATLNIDENNIELGENTLIRIQKDAGPLQIEFSYGNINIVSGAYGGAVLLSIGSQTVQVAPGGGINAFSGDDGLVLRVTEGAAQVIRDGQVRDVSAGEIVVQNADGSEVRRPMAAVIHPKPNANFLKTDSRPLNVEFRWARINLQPQELIRLEIAEDKNFKRITQTIGNLDSRGTASVNAGLWHWRLLHEDTVLASGRMNVTEASAPALLAPTADGSSQIPVKFAGQEVQFRWAEVPDAAYYNLQIAKSPEFIAPEIDLQVQTTNYVNSDINAGTWYWRVMPVFSKAYEGEANFSKTSSFRVQSDAVTISQVLSENNSGAGAMNEAVQEQSAPAGIEVKKEESPEEAFLALREQTRQIWQEQQARQEQRAQQEQQTQIRQSSQTQTRQTDQVPPASQQQPQQQERQESRTQQNQQQALRLTLLSPEQNVIIPGLTAIRRPTVFRWDTNEDIVFSRFVLSRRANPVSGRPEIDIQNPGRTVSVPGLAEGVWYWTVEGRSRDGRPVTAVSPRQIRIQPIPLLPAPGNRLPKDGYTIGEEELRNNQSIDFSWSPVAGANSYILTILKDSFLRKQQVFQTEPLSELTYTFNNFTVFEDSGTFYWQVEAVSYSGSGIIEQRGTPGENSFTLDVPRPGRVRTRSTGVLYGR
jgi:hypothetical protein